MKARPPVQFASRWRMSVVTVSSRPAIRGERTAKATPIPPNAASRPMAARIAKTGARRPRLIATANRTTATATERMEMARAERAKAASRV